MALRGASRAQLLKAGRLRFAGVFSDPLFDGRHPDPGKTVIGYRGDRGALVKDGGGRKLLLKSTLPLQAPAANGELAPVDLSLRESTQTFTTANSNADVQIFKDPARGISLLQQGFSVSDASAASGAQPDGVQTDGRVFFAQAGGSDSDVSFIAVPKPTGVQVGWLLGTADAPETYQLNLDLPEGARVRRTQTDDPIPGDPPRTFEIVDSDGKSLAYITPPMTVDSDGVGVESSMHVVGRDRLVVDVKHHGEDLRYPLFVDPELLGVPRGRSAGDWQGWGTYQTPTVATRIDPTTYNHNYFGWALDHPAYNPSGAYMSMPTHTWFDMGTGRGFEYRAPEGTYVATATFGNISHAAIWGTGTYNMWWQGILNPARSAWQNVSSSYASGSASASAFSGGTSEQNYANIGIMATGANYQGRLWSGDLSAWVKMDWANVYLGDNYPPQLTSAPPANENWSTATTRTRTVSATDHGTKIVTFRLTGPGIDQSTQQSWGEAQTIQYTPAEGSHQYTLTAIDAVGNTSTPQTWTEKIDKTSPELELGGTLAAPFADQRFRGLYEAEYELTVTARDQDQAHAESGAVSVSAQLQRPDGSVVITASKAEACAAGQDCALSLPQPLVVQTDGLPDGPYKVVVKAQDAAGHTTVRNQDVIIDRRGGIYTARKSLAYLTEHEDDTRAVEWARIGTHDARTETGDQVATHTTVADDGTPYDEVRYVSRNGQVADPDTGELDPDAEESVTVTKGADASGRGLDIVADILQPAYDLEQGTPSAVATGPLDLALADGQVPPPDHGATFTAYESEPTPFDDPHGVSASRTVARVTVDTKTKMPIRQIISNIDTGELLLSIRYVYELDRLQSSEVAPTFFRESAPQQVGMSEENRATGAQMPPSVQDADTGRWFAPYHLGLSFGLGERGIFLRTGGNVTNRVLSGVTASGEVEPDLRPEEQGSLIHPTTSTIVMASYQRVESIVSQFIPGLPTSDAPMSVASMHSDGKEARAWAAAYLEAIGNGPGSDPDRSGQVPLNINGTDRIAFVVPSPGGLASALIKLDETTIILKADFTKQTLETITNLLELA